MEGFETWGWLAYVGLTWPMAKRLKLSGITYLVGKISRSNFCFRVHWLSEWGIILHSYVGMIIINH